MLVAQARRQVVFLGKGALVFGESRHSLLLRLALDRRNKLFQIARSLVGAVGERCLTANVDVAAPKVVTHNKFVRQKFVKNAVGGHNVAILEILAHLGRSCLFFSGVINQIGVEIDIETAHLTIKISVQVVLEIVGGARVALHCQVVVKLSVAHSVNQVFRFVFAVHNGLVGVLCAQRILVVNLIVSAEIKRHILIFLRGFGRVVGFPTMVRVVQRVEFDFAAHTVVDVEPRVAEQVEAALAIVETRLLVKNADEIFQTLSGVRFERKTEALARRHDGCDAHHGLNGGVVACARRRYNFHILNIIGR